MLIPKALWTGGIKAAEYKKWQSLLQINYKFRVRFV